MAHKRREDHTYRVEHHSDAVKNISSRVKQFHAAGTQFRIYHGSTNATRPSLRDADRMVDTSRLDHVLSVDTSTQTAFVEPNVPMDALVEATLQHKLLPPVVMEFPGITAGGAFAGIGGESSSFKHGYFDSCVKSIEIVLGNGNVVTASTTENADLFVGAAGTMGTLGVVTLLEISLIPGAAYVQLTYHTVFSAQEAVSRVVEETKVAARNDFVDGIMFSSTSGVVCTGLLTSSLPAGKRPARFLRARDNWYYLHVKSKARRHPFSAPQVDFVPIRDYLFRYDRGAFWMGRYGFYYFPFVPFDRLSRFFLDPLLHTRQMYRAMHESGHYDYYLIQDLGVPCHRAADLIEYTGRGKGVWPLWLCPLIPGNGTKWLREGVTDFALHDAEEVESGIADGHLNGTSTQSKQTMIFNIGVWGPMPSKSYDNFVATNRAIEAKVTALKGVKWPYSQYFYTEDEFWQMYDREGYEALREKYHATGLPTMYDKVKPKERDASRRGPPNGSKGLHGWVLGKTWEWWPVSACYGIAKVMLRGKGDYLVSRRKEATQ